MRNAILIFTAIVAILLSHQWGINRGLEHGYNTGYQAGYSAGYTPAQIPIATEKIVYKDLLRNPTYQEAMDFIEADQTDVMFEDVNSLVCIDYASTVRENANELGYRCAFVYLEFTDSAHAIIAFDTTDKGLVHIEPQLDEVVDEYVKVGHIYPCELGYSDGYKNVSIKSSWRIVRILYIW